MARTKKGCERSKLIKEIRSCFEIENNKNSVVGSLVEELYWQIVKLKECRRLIDGDEISVAFKQGKQDIMIQNPLFKTYNDLIKNQSTTIKSLVSLTGKKTESSKDGLREIADFLNKPKK